MRAIIEVLEKRSFLSASHPIWHVLFNDQFNGTAISESTWSISSGWNLGRSHMNPGNAISSAKSVATLTVSNFNQDNPGTLTGSELDGNKVLNIGKHGITGYTYEVKARFSKNIIGGLVGGIFLYTTDSTVSHDEIDFELLSNQANLHGRKKIDTDAFIQTGKSLYAPIVVGKRFSFFTWHTYKIVCQSGKGTSWYIDNKRVRSSSFVPESPVIPIINFWAADSSWNTAYNQTLEPTNNPQQGNTYGFQIDSVKILVLS